MSRVIDFDAWRKEHALKTGEQPAPKPVVFKIGGVDYELPPEPPALVALDVIRLKEAAGDDKEAVASYADLLKIGVNMFGEEPFRRMMTENRIGAVELGDIILQAFGAWEGVTVGDAVPNRQTRRARKPSTSSKTGRS